MRDDSQSQLEIQDVAEGLWMWRFEHPRRAPDQGWTGRGVESAMSRDGLICQLTSDRSPVASAANAHGKPGKFAWPLHPPTYFRS